MTTIIMHAEVTSKNNSIKKIKSFWNYIKYGIENLHKTTDLGIDQVCFLSRHTTPSEIELDFFVNDTDNILSPYYDHFGKWVV